MKNTKLLILLLAAVQFVHIVDFMIIMPLGPQLMRLLHIDPQQFGFLVGSYTFAAGVSGFLGVFWLDRMDRKKALSFSFLGFLLGTGLCAWMNSYESLLFARLFTGMMGGVLSALVMAIVGDVFPPEKRGQATATIMASFSLAAVLGVPFGLYLSNHFNWQIPFLFLSGFSLCIYLLLILILPPLNQHLHRTVSHQPWQILKEVLSAPSRVIGLSLTATLIIGQFAVIPYIAPYMNFNVGLSEHQLPLIYMTGGALTIITSQGIGRLSDRYGKTKTFRILAIFSLLPFLLVTQLPASPLWLALLSTSLFFILVSGRMIPAMALINGTVEPHRRAAFLSLNSCMQQLGAAAGSTLSGYIIIKNTSGLLENYEWVGYWAIAMTLIGVLLIGYIKENKQS